MQEAFPQSAADSNFDMPSYIMPNYNMVDIGGKLPTRRRAVASGRISALAETIARVRAGTVPKGNVLAIAEVAGMIAAKNTPAMLPMCHPLQLDSVRLKCKVEEKSILVSCEASATARTGVEMEALCAVSAALLCIYDLLKGIDSALSISDIRLQLKEGGKSSIKIDLSSAGAGIRAAAITISDSSFKKEASDISGPQLVDWLKAHGAIEVELMLLPDDKEIIKHAIDSLASGGVDLIVTTGGTGLGPRDVTPEAMHELNLRPVPGIGELLRSKGALHTDRSWLSRGGAGLLGKTLIVTLPGSPKAVQEGLDILGGLLVHAFHIMRGGAHHARR